LNNHASGISGVPSLEMDKGRTFVDLFEGAESYSTSS
jgi:hypothetical protein